MLKYVKNLKHKKIDKLYNAYNDRPIYEPLEDLIEQETKIENLKNNYISK